MSRKQRVTARSSTESKYKELADLTAEITRIQSLLNEIGFHLKQTPIAQCDNLSVNALAFNLVFHARTKHIEIDAYFIRD